MTKKEKVDYFRSILKPGDRLSATVGAIDGQLARSYASDYIYFLHNDSNFIGWYPTGEHISPFKYSWVLYGHEDRMPCPELKADPKKSCLNEPKFKPGDIVRTTELSRESCFEGFKESDGVCLGSGRFFKIINYNPNTQTYKVDIFRNGCCYSYGNYFKEIGLELINTAIGNYLTSGSFTPQKLGYVAKDDQINKESYRYSVGSYLGSLLLSEKNYNQTPVTIATKKNKSRLITVKTN